MGTVPRWRRLAYYTKLEFMRLVLYRITENMARNGVYTVCSKKTTIGVFLGDIAFLMVSDWALVWCVEPFIRSPLVLFVKVSKKR